MLCLESSRLCFEASSGILIVGRTEESLDIGTMMRGSQASWEVTG